MAYTKPQLRKRIKRSVMAGSQGGKPGQVAVIPTHGYI